MKENFKTISTEIFRSPGNDSVSNFAENRIGLTSLNANIIFLVSIIGLTIAGIGFPQTRDFTRAVLDENNVVEMLTFVFSLIGAGTGIYLSYLYLKKPNGFAYAGFFGIFALGLALIGLEEISWGQQLFGFATPEAFAGINAQGETTIHNINGMSGNTEYLRLVFGLGGIFGVWVSSYRPLMKIGAPLFLLPWFIAISGHSVVDVFNDIVPIQRHFDALISELAELMELLIASAAGLYFFTKLRVLAAEKGGKYE